MKICENIYAVGAVDESIRVFHGYRTPVGTTYNAYLVIDEKVTLIDFVKRPFADVLLKNIKAVLGQRAIDYIICNHAEPDHSGALPEVLKKYASAVIYGTAACEKTLGAYYPESAFDFIPVKGCDTLCTGRYTFNFLPVTMVHWPDSMAAYLPQEKILFSNDALGQHIGTGEAFDDELTPEGLFERAGDYYANIVLPFGAQVKKVLEAVKCLDIETVCPSHGVILRKYLPKMLQKYSDWSENKTDEKSAVIVFDTMWGTTRKMARALYDEYTQKGFTAELIDLSEKHHSFAMARLLEAKYIFVGSPTLNNQPMPLVSAFLTYMRGLKPKNRTARAFGSYGWSGEAAGQINDILAACGFEVLPFLRVQWNT